MRMEDALHLLKTLFVLPSILLASVATAGEGELITVQLNDTLNIDGFFDEWASSPSLKLQGQKPGDIQINAQLATTGSDLCLAIQAVDDSFVFGTLSKGDRVKLTVGSGRDKRTVQFALNDLEQNPVRVMIEGKPFSDAVIVGTSRVDGWAFEAKLPLAKLPALMSIGETPFALEIWDSDKGQPETKLSTSPNASLEIDAWSGMERDLEAELGRPLDVLERVVGPVSGKAPAEFLIGKNIIALMGHGLEGGIAYSYFVPGWRDDPQVVEAELVDLDGKGNRELWLIHKEWAVPGEVEIEAIEIYGLYDGQLRRQVAQRLAERHVKTGESVVSKVHRQRKGKAFEIKVDVAEVTGFNPGSYYDVDAESNVPYDPVPLPWQTSKPRIFQLDGPKVKVKE